MADVKISQLPASTTPLAGTELVPIVQSGVTKQATVNEFGAGVGYLPAGTGAVATTVQTKLRETVSAKDFGAVSDGVSNNTAAVQAALDLIDNVDGATAVSGTNVRIGVRATGLYANVIPFANLTWPYNAEFNYQGTTWESVSLKNQFSNPYQAVAVTTTAWAPSTAYTYGTKRVNGGNCYYCIVSGTSAASGGPSGTCSCITDGTVTWKYVTNGYYGPVPVNEWRFHAPYHPGIILDNLTSTSYGSTQPAQQIGADIGATGNPDTSRYKSLVFSQDGGTHWQLVSDGFTSDLNFNHINTSGTNYPYRMYFSGDYGDVGVQINSNINNVGETSYPLMVAGAMKLLCDNRTDNSIVTYTNQTRYTGRPTFYLGYRNDSVNNVSTIQLEGATGYQVGINAPNVVGVTAAVQLTAGNGSGSAKSVYLDGFYNMWSAGSDNVTSLGRSAVRWSVVYAGTGTINTSDAREKQQIRSLSDAEKAVAVRLKSLIKAFKFNDAVEAKGDAARIHVGVIAQEVIAAFEAEGLDANRYAIICYDEWKAESEELDGDGNVVRPARKAGNRYGVRYDELLAFIISAL